MPASCPPGKGGGGHAPAHMFMRTAGGEFYNKVLYIPYIPTWVKYIFHIAAAAAVVVVVVIVVVVIVVYTHINKSAPSTLYK